MNDTVIKVENLGKKYRIGSRQDKHQQFRDVLVGSLIAPLKQLMSMGKNPSEEEIIWALKNISFEVKRGQVLGIIGKNGSGKTTLLKILSRITSPTEGKSEIRGRVGCLLAVGAGFHPEMTGRENIYLNGSILGMTREDINNKFDEIIDFSGIDKFIDTPVKRYSSGMYVRLAFAVAAHLEPEVLLIDEVLAVGDAEFQKKCLGKMSSVAKAGRTVLFVSHNLSSVARLCDRAILLDHGQIVKQGDTNHVISEYLLSHANREGWHIWKNGFADTGIDELQLNAVRIVNKDGKITSILDIRHHFFVEVEYRIFKPLPHCSIGIFIYTVEGILVFQSYDSDQEKYSGSRNPGFYVSKCRIPGNYFNSSRYVLRVYAAQFGIKQYARTENILTFNLEDTGGAGSTTWTKRSGIIRPKLDWVIEKQE